MTKLSQQTKKGNQIAFPSLVAQKDALSFSLEKPDEPTCTQHKDFFPANEAIEVGVYLRDLG